MQQVKAGGLPAVSTNLDTRKTSLWGERRFRKAAGSALVLCVVLLLVSLPFALIGPSVERLVILVLINVAAVVGLNIYTGNSGILTVGHVGFFAVGAYTTALLTTPPEIKAD